MTTPISHVDDLISEIKNKSKRYAHEMQAKAVLFQENVFLYWRIYFHRNILAGMLMVYLCCCNTVTGTCRWGEFGEGGLLWGECSARQFEWFGGNPLNDLLVKVQLRFFFC